MPSRVDLLSLSTKPLRLVHESQFVVMMLQPGAMDLSIDGAPTERLEYVAGDIALCRRRVVGLVQSRDQMKKLRFELSDLHLSEAADEANREIELQSIPKLKDLRDRLDIGWILRGCLPSEHDGQQERAARGSARLQDRPLLFRNGDSDVAVSDDAVVIPLQIERSWLGLIAVKSTSGRAGNLDIVVVHLAIAQNRHMSADQGDVEGCPFSETKFRALRRRIVTVDRSHLMRRELAAFGAHL